jgi:hypothetical protein
VVPAPLSEEPGTELPGEGDVPDEPGDVPDEPGVAPDEPGVVVDGLFSLGLLGAELPVPYEPLLVPYEPVLLAPPAPMDPLLREP